MGIEDYRGLWRIIEDYRGLSGQPLSTSLNPSQLNNPLIALVSYNPLHICVLLYGTKFDFSTLVLLPEAMKTTNNASPALAQCLPN